MEYKEFWKSKTLWGGLLVFLGGGLQAIGLTSYGEPLIALGVALGFVGLRFAAGGLTK
jgi:hypothetical protein